MKSSTKLTVIVTAVASVLLLASCQPKVGSERWCKKMDEKAAADWTAREAKDYAKHCVFD